MEFVDRVRGRFDRQLIAAVLFGSRARGEAESDSDMDVLVVMSNADPEIRKEIRHLAVEVWLEHDIYLSTRVWGQDQWHRLEELQTLLYQNTQPRWHQPFGALSCSCRRVSRSVRCSPPLHFELTLQQVHPERSRRAQDSTQHWAVQEKQVLCAPYLPDNRPISIAILPSKPSTFER